MTAHNEMIPSQLARLEEAVEQRSGVLKKELGLFDLVLTQIVFVVGTIWVGWAAKLGDDQTFFGCSPLSPFICRWPQSLFFSTA